MRAINLTRAISLTRMMSLLFALPAIPVVSHAQTVTTLASFNMTDGSKPYSGPLVQGPNGKLYGTTSGGGAGQNYGGTVFEIDLAGNLNTLYSFCTQSNCSDGEYPYPGLIKARNGNFYGTTGYGGMSSYCPNPTGFGCGTVFEITPTGQLTTLYNFCSLANCSDGSLPVAGLIQARNQNLYGTTNGGGIIGPDGLPGGTIFEITPAGRLTTIYRFCSQINSQGSCADGQSPNGRLVQGSNGNFYGTTAGGGANNSTGTVFEITPAGKLTTLHNFCSQRNSAGYCTDGELPYAGLVSGLDGNLYGTTGNGGSTGYGSVFEVTPTGKLTSLYSFCSQAKCADGDSPQAPLMRASNGNFYGTTEMGGTSTICHFGNLVLGCGTIFEITPAGKLTTLHSFCTESGCSDGQSPYAGLVQAANGILYGTTSAGGDLTCDRGNGCGSVFSLSVGLGPLVEGRPTY
jgi:uncharacterized repeat protein (TIGR03803 family)